MPRGYSGNPFDGKGSEHPISESAIPKAGICGMGIFGRIKTKQ
jgi:hypothetical protein